MDVDIPDKYALYSAGNEEPLEITRLLQMDIYEGSEMVSGSETLKLSIECGNW